MYILEYSSTLRPYQISAVNDLRASIIAGHRRPLLQAPTGSGKTIVAREITQAAVEKGSRVLFLAPRRELIFQTAAKLDAVGLPHGVLMAGVNPDPTGRVQVASIPTLYSRCIKRNHPLPPADLVLVDEAHLAITRSTLAVLDRYAGRPIVGLTATPARGDGRGLGEVFDDLVFGPSVAALVEGGFLVPQRYYAPYAPDLAGVRIRQGDYEVRGLAERLDNAKLVGDVVTNWLRLASDRQTVVFAINIAHSMHLCERFVEEGVRAEHLDANTPNQERSEILQRTVAGETQVLCNCFLLSYGWDCPPISCAVLARPTKSLVLFMQMVGRVLRPSPGKQDALILDHAGAVGELGFVDEEMPWSLDGKTKLGERLEEARKKEAKEPITCQQCHAVYSRQLVCPECGWKPERKGKPVDFLDGDLTEIKRGKRAKKRVYTHEEKRSWFSQLVRIGYERGYKNGWASNKYREKFGVWPTSKPGPAAEVSPEVRSWVKSRQIAWAKRKQMEAA